MIEKFNPVKMHNKHNIDYNRKHDLTIEEVKSCSIFKDLTDEQAQEVIDTIKRFTVIAFEIYMCDKKVDKNIKL